RSRRRVLRSRHGARLDGTQRGGAALLRARSRRVPAKRLRVAREEATRPDQSMKKLFSCALILVVAACASSKAKDDADDIVPPAQTIDDARRTFQKVFDDDPTGDLADNALFWIGETYFAAGNYAEATKYYKRVTVEFSEQNKAPDALFKIALAFEKTSDLGMAKKTLDEVIQRYPYSSAAASAKQELKRIRY